MWCELSSSYLSRSRDTFTSEDTGSNTVTSETRVQRSILYSTLPPPTADCNRLKIWPLLLLSSSSSSLGCTFRHKLQRSLISMELVRSITRPSEFLALLQFQFGSLKTVQIQDWVSLASPILSMSWLIDLLLSDSLVHYYHGLIIIKLTIFL